MVEWLPAYAPDLNPVEPAWSHTKYGDLANYVPETALDLIRLTPEEAGTLVVVGHNPTIAYLAQLLDDGDGDVAASNEMAMGYPTSAVTVMEYDGAWADLGAGTARVLAFHVGRG